MLCVESHRADTMGWSSDFSSSSLAETIGDLMNIISTWINRFPATRDTACWVNAVASVTVGIALMCVATANCTAQNSQVPTTHVQILSNRSVASAAALPNSENDDDTNTGESSEA